MQEQDSQENYKKALYDSINQSHAKGALKSESRLQALQFVIEELFPHSEQILRREKITEELGRLHGRSWRIEGGLFFLVRKHNSGQIHGEWGCLRGMLEAGLNGRVGWVVRKKLATWGRVGFSGSKTH